MLSTVAWVFFEAGSLTAALAVFRGMASPVLWVPPLSGMGMDRWEFLAAGVGFLILTAVDWYSTRTDPARKLAESPRWLRWVVSLALLLVVVVFGSYGSGYDAQSFIYGQF